MVGYETPGLHIKGVRKMSKTKEFIDFILSKQGLECASEEALEFAPEFYHIATLEDSIFLGESRWTNNYKKIYFIADEGTYVAVEEGYGKTEYQDYSEIYHAYEVVKTEKLVVDWVSVTK